VDAEEIIDESKVPKYTIIERALVGMGDFGDNRAVSITTRLLVII
jgi:hypothetical protein